MSFHNDDNYLDWIDQLALNDYVVIDNFIDTELYKLILSFFERKREEESLKKAGIGTFSQHQIDLSVRGDYVYWLDKVRDESLKSFFKLSEELQQKIKRYCFLSISDFECHLAYYPAGTFYKKHYDQFNARSNRLISFVLYLTPEWNYGDGGELAIFQEKEIIKVEPIAKRLVLFKSDKILHEVLITNKARYSLTGWMLNNPVGLGYL